MIWSWVNLRGSKRLSKRKKIESGFDLKFVLKTSLIRSKFETEKAKKSFFTLFMRRRHWLKILEFYFEERFFRKKTLRGKFFEIQKTFLTHFQKAEIFFVFSVNQSWGPNYSDNSNPSSIIFTSINSQENFNLAFIELKCWKNTLLDLGWLKKWIVSSLWAASFRKKDHEYLHHLKLSLYHQLFLCCFYQVCSD